MTIIGPQADIKKHRIDIAEVRTNLFVASLQTEKHTAVINQYCPSIYPLYYYRHTRY